MNSIYYDGTKLLSLKDIDGNTPSIYMVVGNRTAGKTTYFNSLAFRRSFFKNKKFMLLYRYKYELEDIEKKFFKDIKGLYFSNYSVYSKTQAKGSYIELFAGAENETDRTYDKSIGYAVALNSADQIKKLSHIFNDVDFIIFDEFQSETNNYCDREISKFLSIYTSIARGYGKQFINIPVYMISNAISLLNPYFSEMGVSNKLQKNTKFLRGSGWVLEIANNVSSRKAIEQSSIAKAFKNNNYINFSAQNVYLNDNNNFIEKLNGNSKYICTIKFENKNYGLKQFDDIIYCDDKPDMTYPIKISATTKDHNVNFMLLKNNDMIIQHLRYFFENGLFRFKDLNCKNAIIKTLSY